MRKFILFSIPPFVCFAILDMFINGHNKFGNLPNLTEMLILMAVIIFFLFEKMMLAYQTPIYQTINFWLAVGLFVYFAGNFFYILLVQSYEELNEKINNELLIMTSFVTILKNFVLGSALAVKESKETQEEVDSNFPLEMNLDSFTPNNNLN